MALPPLMDGYKNATHSVEEHLVGSKKMEPVEEVINQEYMPVAL